MQRALVVGALFLTVIAGGYAAENALLGSDSSPGAAYAIEKVYRVDSVRRNGVVRKVRRLLQVRTVAVQPVTETERETVVSTMKIRGKSVRLPARRRVEIRSVRVSVPVVSSRVVTAGGKTLTISMTRYVTNERTVTSERPVQAAPVTVTNEKTVATDRPVTLTNERTVTSERPVTVSSTQTVTTERPVTIVQTTARTQTVVQTTTRTQTQTVVQTTTRTQTNEVTQTVPVTVTVGTTVTVKP